MKRIVEIVKKICRFFSLLYPERSINAFKELHKYIYSEKIAKKFVKYPEKMTITPPLQLRGASYMTIGKNFVARRNLILECWDEYESKKYTPELIIGENVNLGENNHIGCINKVTIGNNLLTGRNVYITDHYHGKIDGHDLYKEPIKRTLYSKGSIEIGNNVWIGDNVSIMPNTKIGNNVIIGANAVVTKDIKDNMVVAGVPAKIIKDLSSNEDKCSGINL